MKRFAALAAAALTALTVFTGCGSKKEKATLELNMDNSWHSEKTLTGITHNAMFGVGTHMLCYAEKPNNKQEFVWYDLETGVYERFYSRTSETLTGVERLQCVPIRLYDGNFGIINMVYRGMNEQMEVLRRTMDVYDTQLQFVESREIPSDFWGSDYYYSRTAALDSKGNWYCSSWKEEPETLTVYNSRFEAYGEIEVPYDRTDILVTGADGAVYAFAGTWNEKSQIEVTKIYRLDAEARTCEDIGVYLPAGGYGFASGTQGYTLYYSDQNGIYGVKDNETTQVVSFLNSDFKTASIMNIYPLENGDFVLWEDESDIYWYAKPRSQEEIDNTKLISLATVGLSGELEEAVINYNRAESGYRIVVKDYSEYNTREEPYLGYDTLKKDMLDGIVADMICTEGMNFESLATKGLFADWYSLMDADEEFDRSNYTTNFFEAHEYKGKLLRLGVSYRIHTTTAKTKLVGEAQGMSLGEQLDVELSDGMDRFVLNPSDYMAQSYMHNMQTGCIDRDAAECCFDSPEFVKLLEMLKAIPTSATYYEMNPQFWGSSSPWKDEQILFHELEIAQPIDLHAEYRGTFFDEPATLTGYPMVWDEGNGGVFNASFTVSVNAQSAEKAAIWDFMKHLLSEDYQKKLTAYMPVHEGTLEYKLNEAEHMAGATSGTMNIGEMKEWETDLLRDYIHGIRTCSYFDTKVYTILLEESEKMLADDQTPEETAKMMQSRVSIYLSEQS